MAHGSDVICKDLPVAAISGILEEEQTLDFSLQSDNIFTTVGIDKYMIKRHIMLLNPFNAAAFTETPSSETGM